MNENDTPDDEKDEDKPVPPPPPEDVYDAMNIRRPEDF